MNPLGVCRFYWTDPQKFNVVTGPKSAASARRIKCLLELAKELGRPLTIVVFEGGTVTLLGLLQELHLHLTLLRIPIHTLEEVKMGQKNRISCCPICACIVKNDYAFLNDIVICHYWSRFSCGKCLEFTASSGQQHFPKCGGPKEARKEAHSKGGKSSGPHGGHKSGHKPKKGKKDKVDKDDKCGTKDDKLRRSESKSGDKVLGTLHRSRCIAESTSGGGHHKKSKKCGEKKSHKKSHQKMRP